MEIKINLDHLQPNTMRCECPTCKKDVDSVVLNEYDFYYELYHAECSTEWRFSSYEQCKRLQQLNYENGIREIENDKWTPTFKTAMKIMCTTVFGISTGGVGVPFGLLGGNWMVNLMFDASKEDDIQRALYKSFNIDNFIKNNLLHTTDKTYNKERIENLARYEDMSYYPPINCC